MTILQPLSLALAFTVFPLSLASNHVHSTNTWRHRRQNGVPASLPGNWTSKGCYTDNVGVRTLSGATFASGTTMTTASCIAFCDSKSFIYAGTEFSVHCDNNLHGGVPAPAADCNMPCSGNSLESCGAGGRLNLYWSGEEPPPPPATAPTIGNWTSLGCISDNVNGNGRTLAVGMPVTGDMTQAKCTNACFNAGFPLAGAEFAAECYCGATLANGGAPTPAADCSMVCAGNSSEFCGGPNRLNVYNYTGTDLPPQQPVGGGGGGGGAPVFPVTSGLPGNWSYDACWVDNAFGRAFVVQDNVTPTQTVETCIASCAAKNYTVAGIEFGTECYCGDTLVAGAVKAVESSCNMGCGGNATEACGGPNRLSVYSSTGNVTALPIPIPLNTSLPGQWQYKGCFREPQGFRALPNEIEWPGNNTALACMNQCAAFGYPVSGTEFGLQCFCGDVSDLTASGSTFGAESECALPCPGDPIHLCGGGDRLTMYQWNGDLNVWHKPENTGRYELILASSVVVPLIATVGINNKVTFLEKGGTGFPNSTGAYELDLSLAPQFDKAWREMHIKTDVFCAGSIILPDKGGRQINVGGWSLDSTFGVRLFTPDGVPGVNSTNDWEEDFHQLALQRGRWYPTAAMLANGSILVIGGEIGSNDRAQPNLEVLPKPVGGDTVVELEWLARTDPNNLYPFVMVLPSEHLFVGYWNEARILDPATFDTVSVLPNIPGSVTNCAAVLFPQHAPYTDPLRVLICGGSGTGAGIALDNCVSIAPEEPNPTWVLERMPSRRVLSCMVSLPDGTFMIMNGAHQGVAGFGLATDPNLSAVLYDPTQPLNQRMSVLNSTIVARMYHSEAFLLPDGRIMISGSDPQTDNPDGTVKYPEEFRIEVYIPPYLNQGFRQPEYNITEKDWAYGGTYTITNIKLFQGTTANIRISLLAATSSTHGNTMGSRTIFPAFHCAGTTCTITAPPGAGVSPPGWHMLFILDGPTPSHAQWVRIGGDPSQLGNWPDLPGFTRPGI
ncbi:copper radical oxidase [Collybia nuda]|uniref:Copper radical oxidase n=1 Tax=Collybia nuda TaxID=64659 RepID=A0A9P5YBI5_9AGAR|nr:copper radical oxidase [Collybia nuda]